MVLPCTNHASRRMVVEKYCLEKKWQRIWMLSSVLVLGPLAFLAGMGASKWAAGGGGSKRTAEQASNGGNNGSGNNNIYSHKEWIFLKSGQILTSQDPSICQTPPNDRSSTPTFVCFKLQTNGNLLLFQQTGQASAVLWNSQVSLTPGDYWTRLQSDGNLVTTRGTPKQGSNGNGVIWDSKSISMEAQYRLVWDPTSKGLQIERDDDMEGVVVIWSTAISTWDAGSGDSGGAELTPDDDLVWRPAPVSFPSIAPAVAAPNVPVAPSPTVAVPSPTSTVLTPPPIASAPVTDESELTSKPWFWAPTSSIYTLRSGPMVGHVTDTSVQLWALQGENQAMELVFRVMGASMGTSMIMRPNADQGASILLVDKLQPNTQYEYEVRMQQERIGGGFWKTASPALQPTRFKFLLASCMDVKGSRYPRQPVWNAVLEQGQPDFAMLNGDTVYLNDGDWTDGQEIILERVWYRNLEQRAETNFRNFISKVPMYSVWDDHEYGSNNSDKNQRGKYNSLRAFRNLWANPHAGTATVEGVFYSFYRGNVHFIVCDNRWYRDRYTGSQWGAAQIDWIAGELKSSTGIFKIMISGGDVMARGWSQDMDVLGRIISQNSISGVLFCAGDIHRNEFKTMENGNWPYKIYQITSSGIAREWRRPWAMIHVDTTINDPMVKAHFYGAESTAETTTWSNDPSSSCSSIQGTDRYAEHRCTETIRLSDLTP